MSLRSQIPYALLILFTLIFGVVFAKSDEETLKQSVVKITQISKSGSKSGGAGFIVKVDGNIVYILTALHVVNGSDKAQVEFFNSRDNSLEIDTKKIISNENRKGDLALFHVVVKKDDTLKKISPLSIDTIELKFPERNLVVIGHPSDAKDWIPMNRNYASTTTGHHLFEPAMHEGYSGGPVIRNGKVVSLIVSSVNSVAYGIPASELINFLKGTGGELFDSSSSNLTQIDDQCKLADPPVTPCLFKEKK